MASNGKNPAFKGNKRPSTGAPLASTTKNAPVRVKAKGLNRMPAATRKGGL